MSATNGDSEKGGGKGSLPEFTPGYTTGEKPKLSQPTAEPERPKKMLMSLKPIAIIFVVGAIIIVAGLATGICWSLIYTSIFTNQLSLHLSSTNYGLWKESPIPIYLKLYMYNWTNSEQYSADHNVKPHFQEMGPYVFKQIEYKVNKVWNENNTITFQRKRVWHFEEKMSNGVLSDKITNLNPVVATVGYNMRFKSFFVRDIVNRVMLTLEHKLIITRTVRELLFDGYNDTMLVINKKLKLSKMPYSKFGWFYARNNSETYDGTFNMDTGVSDIHDLGMIKEWNYKNKSDIYSGECGMITGSNGELWPPLPDNDTIPIFVTDVCTKLKLKFENETTHEGLPGNRYHADYMLLDNGTLNADRKCYCEDVECIPSGMMNISSCKYDAPVFISLPHFYLADPVYLDAVDGLDPSREKHDMELSLQPTTGVPLRVRARLQLNMLLQPDPAMSMLKDVKRAFLPMLWFVQEATLTSDYASKVKLLLILPTLGTVTCFGIAGIGFVLAFTAIFMFVRRQWQSDERQVLLPKDDDNDITRVNG